jgi:hypothetical protein
MIRAVRRPSPRASSRRRWAWTPTFPIRSGAVVDLALVGATALRPSLEQELGVESWRLAYYHVEDTLAGDLRFTERAARDGAKLAQAGVPSNTST